MPGAFEGETVTRRGLMTGGVLAVGYVALACLLFVRVYRYGVRTGLIARYSAETVS